MSTPKIVLMTGSSAGIGLATAERLALDPDKRFLVVATVISFAEKGDLVAAVGDALDKTIIIKELDVTKDDQIKSVVDDVIKEHGRIDLFLNIAGVAISGFAETMSRGHMELMFNVNTFGVIRLLQAVLPHMKRKRAGQIIVVTSMAGRVGSPFLEVYTASKFATEGFVESIAAICRQFNIRVSMIEPVMVNTDLLNKGITGGVEKAADDESMDELNRRIARNYSVWLKKQMVFEPSLIVDTMVEVIEAEKPVLRYQVPSEIFQLLLGEKFCDFTGEKLVEWQSSSLETQE